MKYSYNWLQSHIEDTLPSADVLKETIIFHAFEVEGMEVVGDDTIFDIDVLPNRAGDCLSHYGMAREIAGLLNLNFIESAYTLPSASTEVSIDIQTKDCLRYSAVRVEGIHVTPSPDWLVKKLAAVGQRSINTVVDVTNFILLDMGQPTHAFDADKVHGTIVVREAVADEKITTLSGEEKILKAGMMVIADSEKILAIAGIKGGTAAEVTMDTTNIILEIANFDAASVRRTVRALGLPTDASKRFENNLSPHFVESARAKLVGMIHLLAGGGTVTAIGEQYPQPQLEQAISFTLHDIQRLLGNTVTDIMIVQVLDRYGYTYQYSDGYYTLDVPFWRNDITGPHDMAEEVGRVIGYEAIPPAVLPFTPTTVVNEQHEKIRAIKKYLSIQGYNEVMTYTFRKKGELYVTNASKDKSALRTNLSDGLKESYDMNRLNAALLGVDEVKLFEIGVVFTTSPTAATNPSDSPVLESAHIAIADKKGVSEWTVDEYSMQEHTAMAAEDTAVSYGNSGGPHPFKPWSPYPFITRDVAVWVINDAAKAMLQSMVTDFAQKHCVRPAALFDTFSKDGKTSVAYRLVFQSSEKTLTDTEVEVIFQTLVTAISAQSGMIIR